MRSARAGTAFFGVTPLPQGSGHIPTNADCVTCHALDGQVRSGHGDARTPASASGCATCHDTGKTLHRRDQPQDQAGEPRADDGGLRDLPRGEQLHQLRRHGDEAYGYQHWLHDVSRRRARREHRSSGVTPLPQGSGHIPTNADCVSCHASTAKFGPGTPMNHAPVAGTPCATCHETGKSFTGVTIVTRPTAAQDPAHPPTGDCGTCHSSTTSFATGVTGKPANHIPTTQACTLCHTSLPASYKPGVMNHAGISSGCTTCHAVGASGNGVLRRDAAAAGIGPHPDQC